MQRPGGGTWAGGGPLGRSRRLLRGPPRLPEDPGLGPRIYTLPKFLGRATCSWLEVHIVPDFLDLEVVPCGYLYGRL